MKFFVSFSGWWPIFWKDQFLNDPIIQFNLIIIWSKADWTALVCSFVFSFQMKTFQRDDINRTPWRSCDMDLCLRCVFLLQPCAFLYKLSAVMNGINYVIPFYIIGYYVFFSTHVYDISIYISTCYSRFVASFR